MKKACRICGVELEIVDFPTRSVPGGRRIPLARCSLCTKLHQREMYNRHQTKAGKAPPAINIPSELTPETVNEIFRLDEMSGKLYWRHRRVGRRVEAGCENGEGYRRVNYNGKFYTAHRIVFAMVHGRWPAEGMVIDHIDGDPRNNRPGNLREATAQQNTRNTGARRTNKTGVPGVQFDGKKYTAYIRAEGKKHNLGRFDDLALAAAVRRAAEMQYFGEFRRETL